MRRSASLAAVVVSAACFATLAVLATLAYRRGVLPLPLLVWRFALVSLIMGAYLALRSPSALRVRRHEIARFGALSLTGYGAASLCFFFALRHAPASVVAVLLYTYPALVGLAGWLFGKERLGGWRIVALVATFAGCVLVLDPFSGGGAVEPMGVLLGLGAAVGYASFNLLSNRWIEGTSRLVLMTYTFGISALALAAVSLAAGSDLSPAAWTAEVWLLVALIVLVPTFAAVVLYLGGIRGLGASQAAIVSTFEPVFTILLAAAVLGERLLPIQWLGSGLVMAGVVAAELGREATEEVAAI